MSEVLKLNKQQLDIVRNTYKKYLIDSKNQYIYFTIKNGTATVNAYTSGKVVFQGKNFEEMYKSIVLLLKLDTSSIKSNELNETNISNSTKVIISSSIGSDEVGTGDLFGPIVVCAFYSNKDSYDTLKKLGVKDSKSMNDEQIISIAEKLKCNYIYEIVVCNNIKYNEYVAKGYNMNKIKALLHNHAITKLMSNNSEIELDDVIMDQFTTPKSYFGYLEGRENVYKNIKFFTKGESVSINIAAASIMARAEFVRLFDLLSNEVGFKLKKGAGNLVDEQLVKLLVENNEEYLKNICKMNFRNIDKVKKSRFLN